MNFTVVGSGYVGMSTAVLIGQTNKVTILDIDKDRVNLINDKKSPIKDEYVESFIIKDNMNVKATLDKELGYKDSKFIIIATPTDYDPELNFFDTSSVELVIKDILDINRDCIIIIKSTIPVGFTEKMKSKFSYENIIFVPEFLREGRALYDNLYPSRIIIGSNTDDAHFFGKILKVNAKKDDINILYMNSNEAEAVKLFANTYLAMRVSFFNELDSYAEIKKLSTKNIIKGVSSDDRIGEFYNNPSFGYGGYCLPKDTKQLLSNFDNVPQNLIEAIVKSNSTRKDFIANEIIKRKPKLVGIYRLVMKEGSDNFRNSSIQGIMKRIKAKGIKILLYEPLYKEPKFFGSEVISDKDLFLDTCDIIISNRYASELKRVASKIYTRDIFEEN